MFNTVTIVGVGLISGSFSLALKERALVKKVIGVSRTAASAQKAIELGLIDEVLPLEEAIHKLSGLAAARLKLKKRGELHPGNYADIVIFDPAAVRANSTYEHPHQLASGVSDVFVNGVQVLKDGVHTGATPGRAVYGPGYKGQ